MAACLFSIFWQEKRGIVWNSHIIRIVAGFSAKCLVED